MNLVDVLLDKSAKLQEQEEYAEARMLMERVVQLEPAHAEALSQLGQICGLMGDHLAARSYLEKAVECEPDLLDAEFSLGVEYCVTGRYDDAIARFDKLLKYLPDLPVLYRWKGNALGELGRNQEALQEYESAIRLLPEYSEALVSLGSLLIKEGRLDESEGYFKRALEIDPHNGAAHNDLSRLYRSQGHAEEALVYNRKALALEPKNRMAAGNVLYGLCYLDNASPEAVADEHRQLGQEHYPLPLNWTPPWTSLDLPRRPLHVAYLSGDFCNHSVSYFLEPILQHHDQSRCKIYCYSNKNISDQTTLRMKSLGTEWREIFGLMPEQIADLMIQDRIDILVDLSGHTSGNRLDVCALRPAPVQVCWLGYPHSTGLKQIDYYLSDSLCDPPGMTDHLYSEQVWRLPRVFNCYLPPPEFPPVSPPPCSSGVGVTFGCFNNFAKVNDGLVALWAKILAAVPGSRLCIKSMALGSDSTRQFVSARFDAHGIDQGRILVNQAIPSIVGHLAHYSQIDIALDTYPYHGTTTTCEALWMGVPVVTLAGRTHLSRVGVSLLENVGLADLVAHSPEEYVRVAAALAHDRERLSALRYDLRRNMAFSPLMDAAGLTREVEDAFTEMYSRAVAQQKEY